nr:hypothetical protein [Tanacetum cinerariifolium]
MGGKGGGVVAWQVRQGRGRSSDGRGVVASVSLANREAHRGPSVVWWQPGGGVDGLGGRPWGAGHSGVGRGGSSPWRLAVVAGVVHGGGSGRSCRGGRLGVAVMVGWRWGGCQWRQGGVVRVRFAIIQNKDSGSVGYGGVAVGVAVRGGGGVVVVDKCAKNSSHTIVNT